MWMTTISRLSACCSVLIFSMISSGVPIGWVARRAAGAGLGHPDVGGLAREVLLVAGNAGVARVVPLEVVVLSREELVVEVLPPFLGLRGGLRAVHPQQRDGLVRRQPQL